MNGSAHLRKMCWKPPTMNRAAHRCKECKKWIGMVFFHRFCFLRESTIGDKIVLGRNSHWLLVVQQGCNGDRVQ